MIFWKDKETECTVGEPNCAEEWCTQIWEIGCDYDGCETADSLKSLINELVEMALKARECIYNNKITINSPGVKEEQEKSLKKIFSK